MKRIFLSITLLFLFGCSETKNKKVQSYEAGFKTIRSTDTARIYKPGTDTTNYLHYRPLDIDMWYPAGSSTTDSVLVFRDILELLEKGQTIIPRQIQEMA